MKNNALVVVDMLYDFIDGSLACLNADAAVKATLRHIDSQCAGQSPPYSLKDEWSAG